MIKQTKLWKVHFQSKKYSGDHEDVIVQARNIINAVEHACKLTYITDKSKLNCVESVELIGVARN